MKRILYTFIILSTVWFTGDDNAKLIIGNNVYFNENNMISVKSSVEILTADGLLYELE